MNRPDAQLSLLRAALNEVGLTEVRPNDDGQGRIREYFVHGCGWDPAKWDGLPNKPAYCAAFVSWCAKATNLRFRGAAQVSSLHQWAVTREALIPATEGSLSLVLPGTLALFTSHVGVVEAVDRVTIHTVEGNTWTGNSGNQGVRRRTHPLSSIDAFATFDVFYPLADR